MADPGLGFPLLTRKHVGSRSLKVPKTLWVLRLLGDSCRIFVFVAKDALLELPAGGRGEEQNVKHRGSRVTSLSQGSWPIGLELMVTPL